MTYEFHLRAIDEAVSIGLLALLWLGSLQLESGDLSAADLVSLLLYAALLTSPIGSLANVYGQVQRARGGAERILAIVKLAPGSALVVHPTAVPDLAGTGIWQIVLRPRLLPY
ncbi:MAG: hypothetical protein DRR06_12710 [Gammaproteobacteria bacterium]|nr:MAG: hypothetical protein DRR06_12710 [Gammaproteobacteria bacterium]